MRTRAGTEICHSSRVLLLVVQPATFALVPNVNYSSAEKSSNGNQVVQDSLIVCDLALME